LFCRPLKRALINSTLRFPSAEALGYKKTRIAIRVTRFALTLREVMERLQRINTSRILSPAKAGFNQLNPSFFPSAEALGYGKTAHCLLPYGF
jgi:hypothetical protein